MKRLFSLFCVGVLGVTAAVAHAGTITDMGSVYTLTYTSAGTNLFDVHLRIDTTNFQTAGDFLNAVGLKIVNQNSDFLSATTLISGPAGYGTGASNNTFPAATIDGGVNANGCSGNGGGFFCSPYLGAGFGVPVGHVYDFTWLVNTTLADLFTGIDEASVKALYLDSTGQQNGITSRQITLDPGPTPPIPEPSSLILLGSGVLAAAGIARRKMMASLRN